MHTTEDAQAMAVVDGLAGIIHFDCVVCSKPGKRHDLWRNYRDDHCDGCKCLGDQPGDGAFRLFHLARRGLRRVFR